MSIVAKIAEILVLVGALNWGLVGLFKFNLVETIFGEATMLTKIIYILVGASALVFILAKFIPAM